MNAPDPTHSLIGESSRISASDKSKLLLFFLLYLPTLYIMGLGVLPGVFLAFGLVMLWRDKDFSHIEVAHRNFSVCILLFWIAALGLSIAVALHAAWIYPLNALHDDYVKAAFLAVFSTSAWLLYRWCAKHLFFLPLQRNQAWLTTYRSSGGEPKKVTAQKLAGGSVAGEIEKLIALKEAGHLTEAEFQTAKETLLARM